MGISIQQELDDGKVVTDEMLNTLSEKLAKIRTAQATKDSFMNFGKNNSSRETVNELIYGEENDDVIPTGIPEFDRESGGFLRGSLVTIGANSGGGKSISANHIAKSMAERGFKVVVVPLEMSKVEMTARIIASIAELDSISILQRRLAKGEKEKAIASYEKWVKRTKKRGGRLTVFKPEGDVGIEDIFTALATLDADVVIVDYISLLAGTDGDDSWRQLGAIARKAKINAEATKRVNILLCQINDDGKVRYARSISEHSSASFVWVTSKDEREKEIGRIKIDQPKARNSRSFPFEVGVHWKYMKFVSVDDVTNDVGDVGSLKNLATDL
jgi:predicted ATP-dependent serine protease